MRLRTLSVALVVAAAIAGCSDHSPAVSAAPPGGSNLVSPSQPAPSVAASTVDSPVPTGSKPAASPSRPAPSPSASIDASPDPAAACTGNGDNRDFFDQFASSVEWPVYCAVLPAGWVVDAGSYRLAGGGLLDITYRGPSGSRLELQEGSFCTDGTSECSGHDAWIGTIAFADRSAQLGTLGGKLVAYVAPGESPAWQATGTGLDQASFTKDCAALVQVPN